MVVAWLQFLACMAVIAIAGPSLTRSGHAIARLSGMSQGWAGLILLARFRLPDFTSWICSGNICIIL